MPNLARRQLGQMFAASGGILLFGRSTWAQTVPVFDDAPSIEQLRSIMVPESAGRGLSRSIVIQRPDSGPSAVQGVSTVPPAPHAPAAQATPSKSALAVAFHINFGFNSAALPPESHRMIDLMAQLMQESPAVKVRVEGHTDATGSAAYNLELSKRRALSVGEYLVSKGVEPVRLMLVGKGMSEPLTRDRYDPANRRVQFVRIA